MKERVKSVQKESVDKNFAMVSVEEVKKFYEKFSDKFDHEKKLNAETYPVNDRKIDDIVLAIKDFKAYDRDEDGLDYEFTYFGETICMGDRIVLDGLGTKVNLDAGIVYEGLWNKGV